LGRIDFKAELIAREMMASGDSLPVLGKRPGSAIELLPENTLSETSKRVKLDFVITNPFAQDADLCFDDDSEPEDLDDRDDEELEMQREYERIKKEREEETRRKEHAKLEELR
jgi:hypothetical protein